ncbi:hypothetical protein F0344_02215 [Streptomyces finlayi]|uniref:DUF6777 domain-containing protein n=1 Tax=Streptomyces finlayi TaxID=67296 RepID=A0A7G7BE21_9ACTN|nr:DUF6777 domain-containing protein [Streptomyces finlayi]QNE73586.1 hypothetical protein F0344_02215 [Streptomyces finlayi]
MRSPQRPRRTASVALSVGVLLVAGCGQGAGGGESGTPGTAGAKELFLQSAVSPGPAPFTGSTAGSPPPAATASPAALTEVTERAVSGATPGLYGGTRSVASCDVEQQVRFLAGDAVKARAFAEAAGIRQKEIPAFLRGLTPVLLRTDIRVTGHGYDKEAGSPTAFQSVLQAGTAVLTDTHGTPRVRCVCGNPLGAPVVMKGSLAYRGKEWADYDPNRVLVIEPSIRAIRDLVIVDVADGTWIERPAGDDGAQDRTPEDPPPFEPGDGIVPSPDTSTASPEPSAPASPEPPSAVPPGEPTEEVGEAPEDVPREEVMEAPADELYEAPPDRSGDSGAAGEPGGSGLWQEAPSDGDQGPDGEAPPVSGGPDAAASLVG